MTDRCNPNPCKHSGICKQNSMEFFCDCTNTGYSGAVCHTCKLRGELYIYGCIGISDDVRQMDLKG